MSPSSAKKIDPEENGEGCDEMSLEERAALHAAIAESDAQIARGEVFPAEALFDVIRRSYAAK
jgi:hypothetical protein